VVLAANSAALARLLSDQSNLDIVQMAISEVLSGEWRVSVLAIGDSGVPAPDSRSGSWASEPPEPDAEFTHQRTADRGSDRGDSPRLASRTVQVPPPKAAEDSIEDYDVSSAPSTEARLDPGEQAMALLQSELGARPIED
jgi:DNA polymerase-3 subunit gamma/tau